MSNFMKISCQMQKFSIQGLDFDMWVYMAAICYIGSIWAIYSEITAMPWITIYAKFHEDILSTRNVFRTMILIFQVAWQQHSLYNIFINKCESMTCTKIKNININIKDWQEFLIKLDYFLLSTCKHNHFYNITTFDNFICKKN